MSWWIYTDSHFSTQAQVVGVVLLAMLVIGVTWLYIAQLRLRRRLRAQGQLPPAPKRQRKGRGSPRDLNR